MNKTLIFVTFAILIALALVGTMMILFVSPAHFSSFTGFIVVLLGIAATFATTVSALDRTKKEVAEHKHEMSTKLDVVQRQTNGTLTRLIENGEEKSRLLIEKDEEIAQLRAALNLPAVKGKSHE